MARYTAVGTPELVTSWVADPSLLVSNRGLPERLVIDALDFQRRQQDVLNGWGDHYDIFVWYWLEFLRLSGYVYLVNFQSVISPEITEEIGFKARELSLRVDSAKLREDYAQAHKDWLRFGLATRDRLKRDDPLHELARKMTEGEVSRLERGGDPRVDPILLEARCTAKLLTGVQVARSVGPLFGITQVFDTPQHEPFADRLETETLHGLEVFAISAKGYEETSDRLQDVMERLGLPFLKYPFVLGQLELLEGSLGELDKLQREIGNPQFVWHEVEKRIRNHRQIMNDKRWTEVRYMVASAIAAIASPPSAPYALLTGLASAWLIEWQLTDLYKAMPHYVKLALASKIMARINRRPNVEELGTLALVALRRTAIRLRAKLRRRVRPPDELERESLMREEIGNWVSNEVWYHPHW